MTTFVASQAVDLSSLDEFGILNAANIGSATFEGDNSNIVVTSGGVEIKFTGDFPASEPSNEGDLWSGIITGIEVRVSGSLSYTISDISLLGSNLHLYVDATDPNAWIGDVLLAGDDTITGSDFADTLYGYGGADTIHGGGGDDMLVVQSPGDVVAGETYDGDGENDTLTVTSNADVDLSAVTFSNIENLTGTHFSTTLSLTAAQLEGFSGSIAVAYAITLTTAGTVDLTGQAVTTPIFNLSDLGNMLNLGGVDFVYDIRGGNAADVITGGDLLTEVGDLIDGRDGNDTLNGGAGNDDLTGGAGDDQIDGGADAYDTAHYSGNLEDYSVDDHGDGTYTVIDQRSGSPDGTDELSHVEYLQFATGDPVFLGLGPNEPPVITSNGGDESASINVAENDSLVTTVTASDPDGASGLTYAIVGGADQHLFKIDEWTGELSFNAAPDYESPEDSGGDNVYDVVVEVSDGEATDTQAIAVTVTNQNEAPEFTSFGGNESGSVDVAENGTAVTTVAATDQDTDTTLTYSLSGSDASLFAISAAGELSFISAPDFETPGDSGGDNFYDVIVEVSDGELTDSQQITVTVTGENEAPAINSNGGDESASVEVAEDSTFVTTVTAVDQDAGDTATYAIVGGIDSALFTIDTYTGVLSFNSAPDYESPADYGGDNVYEVVVEATDGSLTDTQNIAITVTDGNDAPTIDSDGGGDNACVSVRENCAVVTTVTATVANPYSELTYAIIGGADKSLFTIDGESGVLSFISAPDYEAPGDSDGDNRYDVIVEVSDGSLSDSQQLDVKVTNRNEAPVITSDGGGACATIDVADNSTSVTTVTASDPDAEQALTYSISGGCDAELFVIDESTGELSFISPPDFESPGDQDGDNVYDVVVQVCDGSLRDRQRIAVTVTAEENRAPSITSNDGGSTAVVDVAENGTLVTTVTSVDPDDGATATYSISGGADALKFSIDAGTGELRFVTAPNFEVPTDAGADNVYDVIVQVSDGELTDSQAIAVTVTNSNDAPRITLNGGGESSCVEIVEGDTAVATVTATDPDAGAALTYSIKGGADALKFSIDAVTGALSFITAPNFEAPTDAGGNNVYDVIVRVSDGSQFDTQSIAVKVTNRNEAPAITSNGGGATATVNVLENAGAVTTVTSVDPDAAAPRIYSISGGADALKFSINAVTGALRFVAAPNFEAPTDAGANNVYDVIVRASDGVLFDTQSIAVRVINTGGVTINGSAGNDVVDVASTVAGQPLPTREDDKINGLGGNDRLFGIDGNDIITGGLGNDVLKGGLGRDFLDGGVGSDLADYSDKMASVVVALDAAGNAIVRVGGVVEDTLRNIEGLIGGAAGDGLVGNGLANLLNGGGGADLLRGLGGNDVYVIDNAGDVADESVAGSNGIDLVQSSVSFSLADGVRAKGSIEYLTLIGTADINGTGNGLANIITGNIGNNILSGGGGDDIMRGGAGNDTYVVNSPGDRVDEQLNGGAGIDTVRSSIGFSLAVSAQVQGAVENLVLAQVVTALAATGNGLANVLIGNSFANVLDGGGGADTMRGGAGNDVYVVNDALDIVDEASNGGAGVFDMVRSSISFSLLGSAGLQGAVENLVLTGAAVSGTGNALRNAISGNAAANFLDGGLGSDSLQGGLGNDVFVFSTALSAATNLDSVVDFSNAAGNNDSFRLDNAIFTSLAPGAALDPLFFRDGAAAADSNDFIVYNRPTGALSYDADGNGGGLAVQFATLLNKPLLTASDFSVI